MSKRSHNMHYFNELVYFNVLEKCNQLFVDLKDASSDTSMRVDYIGTTEGRLLKSQFIKEIQSRMDCSPDDLSNVRPSIFKESLFATLERRASYAGLTSDMLANIYNESQAYLKDYLGNYPDMIPVSPFDDKFKHLDLSIQGGFKMHHLDIMDIPQEERSRDNIDKMMSSGLMCYDYAGVNVSNYQTPKQLVSKYDRSGIARMSPYISPGDYNAVKDWASEISKGDNFMSEVAINRSVEILKYLNEEGISYTVKKDINMGQILASTSDGISVRLTDTADNENYVGSVYDSGKRIYMMSSKQSSNDFSKREPFDFTIEDSITCMKYALGKPVDDDYGKPVGIANTYNARTGKGPKVYNTSYSGDNGLVARVRKLSATDASFVNLRVTKSPLGDAVRFKDAAEAELYIADAVSSSKDNFKKAIELDMLIDYAKLHAENPDIIPSLSPELEVASVQQVYFDILTGKHSDLLIPPYTTEDYKIQKELDDSGVGSTIGLSNMIYNDSLLPLEKINLHMKDHTDIIIGNAYVPKGSGQGLFNPNLVVKYMDSESMTPRVITESMVNAIKAVDIDVSDLIGSDVESKLMKDKLIKFNEETATLMKDSTHPMMDVYLSEILDTVNSSGYVLNEDSVFLDENGIVKYTALKNSKRDTSLKTAQTEITGYIGQIFVQDDLGLVETKFAGSDNYLFSPGYEARVVAQKDGEDLSLEERTRLKGMEQLMIDKIRRQLRSDLTNSFIQETGTNVSLNGVYKQLYDERYPLDHIAITDELKLDKVLRDDIFKTNCRRVRYSNELKQGSTINAEYQASIGRVDYNDNFQNMYELTGRRNLSILSEESDGYFDKDATSSSMNQGITRYLVEGAVVTPDGKIIRSDDLNDRTPLMKNKIFRYSEHIPFDRRQMTFSNVIKAQCVASNIMTTQMTFGGWGFDDGYVVSKSFAETYAIRTKTEKGIRPLTIGDKISDMNGNKGVISLVVDPEMDLEEARNSGIEEAVKWFKTNEGLDIVGAPFSASSRFNGGSAKELMEKPINLHSPDGRVFEGCVGFTTYIVTPMAVDDKSHVYSEEDLIAGKGRKASPQLAWALASQDATNVLDELYNSNDRAMLDLREYLIAVGLDIDEVGNFKTSYTPHEGEERNIIKLPDPSDTLTKSGGINQRDYKKLLVKAIGQKGGFMEIPFELKLADKSLEKSETDDTKFRLPVMSSHLRAGQEFVDGTSSVHDYTIQYLKIGELCAKYEHEKASGNDINLKTYETQCQLELNKITSDVISRKFDGKHNIFRDNIMSNKLSNSATAVWTGDPRLDIDQIAMNQEMCDALDVGGNGYLLCWRDPVLRDAGVRYLRIKVDNTLTGVAINPAQDKCFDGDFDGDSIGIVGLKSYKSHAEAVRKLSVGGNLLDKGCGTGFHEIMLQESLDMKSAAYENKELDERRRDITKRVNKFESEMDESNIWNQRNEAVVELSKHTRASMLKEYGNDMVSYKDMPSHMKSLEHMVLNGAKGSHSKLKDYGTFLGVEFKLTDDEVPVIDVDSVVDHGVSRTTRKRDKDTQFAQAVKSFGTGNAGMFSQRGISVLRNVSPKAVLELTYPVTQAILQAKHDPVDARHKYEMLCSTVKDLWKGYELEKSGHGKDCHWKVKRDNNGYPIRATPERFKSQFKDIYKSEGGLDIDINDEYVDIITDALTAVDNNDKAYIMNIETEAKEKLASPMDRLAYNGTFDDLLSVAIDGKNLFEGKFNEHFKPRIIRTNELIKAGELDKPIKSLTKGDTKMDYVKKVKNVCSMNVTPKQSTSNDLSSYDSLNNYKDSMYDDSQDTVHNSIDF